MKIMNANIACMYVNIIVNGMINKICRLKSVFNKKSNRNFQILIIMKG